MKKLYAASVIHLTLLFSSSFGQVNPYKFLATLKFDDQYQDYLTGKKEQVFPVSFRFNTIQDGNGDSIIDPEDACENIVRYSIGDSIFGTGRTGLANRGPNDQRPAVYFHFYKRNNYDVYQYWLYYADNDYLNDHEHDWEKYFVYTQDSNPVYVRISNHSNFNLFTWCELPKDSDHIIIGVDGGAHAMGNNNQNGVKIGFNGDISKNSGKLDVGDGMNFTWNIYSNHPSVLDAISYLQSPGDFFHGDPVYPDVPQLSSSDEYGEPSSAPWNRSEWDDPPLVPIVYLGPDTFICPGSQLTLSAENGYDSYLWSTGETSQAISVSDTGLYTIEVSDGGCISRDTILITGCTNTSYEKIHAGVDVFPNPTDGKIFIRIDADLINNEYPEFIIFDVSGRKIKKTSIKKELTELTIEKFPSGLYRYALKLNKEIIHSGNIIYSAK